MRRFQAGDRFPNIRFYTAFEEGQEVADILKGKTVFWFLRYIGCTVCNYDIHLLRERYQEFTSLGAQVFVVMQSDTAHVQADLGEETLPFAIICDEEKAFYEVLGIEPAKTELELVGKNKERLDEKAQKAEALGIRHGDYEGDELQLPALFVVEENGEISYAHYATELMDMPGIDEMLDILGKP